MREHARARGSGPAELQSLRFELESRSICGSRTGQPCDALCVCEVVQLAGTIWRRAKTILRNKPRLLLRGPGGGHRKLSADDEVPSSRAALAASSGTSDAGSRPGRRLPTLGSPTLAS